MILVGGYFLITQQKDNTVVCTQEARQCPDGTYVSREFPDCNFAECPGTVMPYLDDNYEEPQEIQLPPNVISEADCEAQGGEIFNTLGETSYAGELIGTIEGLRCPCACRVEKKEIEGRDCEIDSDCVVFGKTGDCNCGCYNKNNIPSGTGGECFCAAPTSCECINNQCGGVFE